MKLKFKPLNFESGRPIALINNYISEKHNIYEGTRIEVHYKRKKLIARVNTAKKLLKRNEISFSSEAVSFLKIKKGEQVKIVPALWTKSTEFIFKKLNGVELTKKEILTIIKDIVANALNEAEIAYFVSGVYYNGMSLNETIYLTEAMARTGKMLKWRGRVADKHSIGGIPGNRTTPIVVPICAAAGITMPKTSSRAITSAAGTADVMDTIAHVSLSPQELKKVVLKTNACLAWGGSLGMAPADEKLIKVERSLNVDPESQLIASILSKKLSTGSKYILIDIPYGKGAKVSFSEAKKLKKKFLKVGKHFKLKMNVVLTPGAEPIGNGVGPILEMVDILKILKKRQPPARLRKKIYFSCLPVIGSNRQGKKRTGQNPR